MRDEDQSVVSRDEMCIYSTLVLSAKEEPLINS